MDSCHALTSIKAYLPLSESLKFYRKIFHKMVQMYYILNMFILIFFLISKVYFLNGKVNG